jgi:hypothetical protein
MLARCFIVMFHDVIVILLNKAVETARRRGPLLRGHFSVDGTLIQAWAGRKIKQLSTAVTPATCPAAVPASAIILSSGTSSIGYTFSPSAQVKISTVSTLA